MKPVKEENKKPLLTEELGSKGTLRMRFRAYLLRKLIGQHVTIYVTEMANNGYLIEVDDTKRQWVLLKIGIKKTAVEKHRVRYQLKTYFQYRYFKSEGNDRG